MKPGTAWTPQAIRKAAGPETLTAAVFSSMGAGRGGGQALSEESDGKAIVEAFTIFLVMLFEGKRDEKVLGCVGDLDGVEDLGKA
jgi:hypothetical protein